MEGAGKYKPATALYVLLCPCVPLLSLDVRAMSKVGVGCVPDNSRVVVENVFTTQVMGLDTMNST